MANDPVVVDVEFAKTAVGNLWYPATSLRILGQRIASSDQLDDESGGCPRRIARDETLDLEHALPGLLGPDDLPAPPPRSRSASGPDWQSGAKPLSESPH
jgi:hypothetical protein